MRPNVMLAIPTFTGNIDYKCTGSLIKAACILQQSGIDLHLGFLPDLQFVDVARNFQVTSFLQDKPECTHLFFVDDDVGFPPEKMLEFLNHDLPIVGGCYPLRKDGPQEYAVKLNCDDYQLKQKNGLIKAYHIPMGFTCIRRDVIEKIASESEVYTFAHRYEQNKTIFDVFSRGPMDGEYTGEDIMFCMKAIGAGFDIWVDPNIQFSHRGAKHWVGIFANAVNATLAKDDRVSVVEEAA